MSKIKISTQRTELRLINISDLNEIHQLHSLKETDEYNTLGIPKTISETQSIIEPLIEANQQTPIHQYTFAIVNNMTRQFIGLFGLKLGHQKYKRGEVWFKIHVNYWEKGYASEALKAVINFGFNTLHLHRIEAGCAVGNAASKRVLEKTGFIQEGRGRQVLPLKSGWSDNFEYAILESDKRN
ncbi:MAG: GNAT family N-acetyltransferase [Crocinitomicaceae bacterium]